MPVSSRSNALHKPVAFVLAMALASTGLPAQVFAEVDSTPSTSASMGVSAPSALDSGTLGDANWEFLSDGTLHISAVSGTSGQMGEKSGSFPWSSHAADITAVKIEPGVKLPSNCEEMFRDCNSMTSFEAAGVDASQVTTMHNMFYNCGALASIDLSSWNTASLESTEYLFSRCFALQNANVSTWNTSKVTKANGMFDSCAALESLDISQWDTSSMTNVNSMFSGCGKLAALSLPSFASGTITNNARMFEGCSSLKELDLSNFNTSSVTQMGSVFASCSSLERLDLSGWDSSHAFWKDGMFYGCDALSSVTFGAEFDASAAFSTISFDDTTWWSAAKANWMTIDEIRASEKGLADTLSKKGNVAQLSFSGLADQTFNGSAFEPSVMVSLGNEALERGVDYELAYADNVNAGTAKVTVTGLGKYEGSTELTFAIAPKAVKVKADNKTKAYGEADPELTATVEGTIASDTVAYELTRVAGEKPGSYKITAAGEAEQGNYLVTFEEGTLTIGEKAVPGNPASPKKAAEKEANKKAVSKSKAASTSKATNAKKKALPKTNDPASYVLMERLVVASFICAAVGVLLRCRVMKDEK